MLVLNYHRIGNAERDAFDPGVFSATSDQFNEQVAYLKRHVQLVTLEEAQAFIDGPLKERTARFRVLITFDDGYLDNYEIAFPILRSHGVQGVFFLVTDLVGSRAVPWWDHVAFVMKTARQRRFALRFPSETAVDLDADGIAKGLREVLNLFRQPANDNPERFLRELQEASGGQEPPADLRRFLDWDEARAMIGGGMAIGSHTHSHPVLSHLQPEQQCEELTQSRAILREKLNIPADSLAYPAGLTTSFSAQTQQFARDAGYRAAFSFYGGTNAPGEMNPYDVKRCAVGDQSPPRFRVQAEVCRLTGRYWP